jgi:hypothetical protein
MGLAMLVGSALTSRFVLRYLVPTVPLLVCGGFAAAADLAGLRRAAPPSSRQSRSRSPCPKTTA